MHSLGFLILLAPAAWGQNDSPAPRGSWGAFGRTPSMIVSPAPAPSAAPAAKEQKPRRDTSHWVGAPYGDDLRPRPKKVEPAPTPDPPQRSEPVARPRLPRRRLASYGGFPPPQSDYGGFPPPPPPRQANAASRVSRFFQPPAEQPHGNFPPPRGNFPPPARVRSPSGLTPEQQLENWLGPRSAIHPASHARERSVLHTLPDPAPDWRDDSKTLGTVIEPIPAAIVERTPTAVPEGAVSAGEIIYEDMGFDDGLQQIGRVVLRDYTVFRGGEMLLGIAPTYQWEHDDIVVNQAGASPTEYPYERRRLRQFSLPLSIQAGLSNKWSVFAATPLAFGHYERSSPQELVDTSAFGVGDLTAGLRYLLHEDQDGTRPNWLAEISTTAPLGRYKRRDDYVNLGDGFWEIQGRLAGERTYWSNLHNPVSLYGSMGYTHRVSRWGIDPGGSFDWSLGAAMPLNRLIAASLTLEGQFIALSRADGIRLNDSRSEPIAAKLELTRHLKNDWFISYFGRAGLNEDSQTYSVGVVFSRLTGWCGPCGIKKPSCNLFSKCGLFGGGCGNPCGDCGDAACLGCQ